MKTAGAAAIRLAVANAAEAEDDPKGGARDLRLGKRLLNAADRGGKGEKWTNCRSR